MECFYLGFEIPFKYNCRCLKVCSIKYAYNILLHTFRHLISPSEFVLHPRYIYIFNYDFTNLFVRVLMPSISKTLGIQNIFPFCHLPPVVPP